MNPTAAIVGAGAVGGWIGDALDRAGWKVSMVARGATMDTLRTTGLRVARGGEIRLSRPQAGAAPELGVQDYVFLAVKAQFLPELAPRLGALFGPATVVISATNGIPWWFFHDFGGPLANHSLQSVDPNQTQERAFPRERTLGAVVHASMRVISPANVQVVAADRLILGEPSGSDSKRVEAVVRALREGGINAVASNCIRREVWTKLWGNMTMNPLSALTRRGTTGMLSNRYVRELCVRMMEEMQHCAAPLNLAVAMKPEERIAVTERLGDFKTSMLADLEAGRPLELDPQLGAVVEIAGFLEIPVPFLNAVLGLTTLISP